MRESRAPAWLVQGCQPQPAGPRFQVRYQLSPRLRQGRGLPPASCSPPAPPGPGPPDATALLLRSLLPLLSCTCLLACRVRRVGTSLQGRPSTFHHPFGLHGQVAGRDAATLSSYSVTGMASGSCSVDPAQKQGLRNTCRHRYATSVTASLVS